MWHLLRCSRLSRCCSTPLRRAIPKRAVQDLRKLFEQLIGPVAQAEIVRDRLTGLSKGFGFVTFVAAADAVRALGSSQRRLAAALSLDNSCERPALVRGRAHAPLNPLLCLPAPPPPHPYLPSTATTSLGYYWFGRALAVSPALPVGYGPAPRAAAPFRYH